jgi:outer membrane protein assembly factor BamB
MALLPAAGIAAAAASSHVTDGAHRFMGLAGGSPGVAGATTVISGAGAGRAAMSQATATTHVSLLPAIGTPASTVTVSGSRFGANEAVDIYFDTTDEALATTNASGAFRGVAVSIPASAVPGIHWVTAVGRHSGLAAQAAFTVRANWPQFRDAPTHRGFSTTENVLSPSSVSGLDNDWSYATGGQVNSSPVVASGAVYVGSVDGSLYALNASSGALLWSFAAGASIEQSPAVANGVVYVGSNGDNVYALNASSGALLWSYDTGGQVNSSPAVADGVVYVGSNDSLFALSAVTGSLLWSFATGAPINSSPAVANGVVYVGSFDDNLYALNAATGTLVWSAPTLSAVASSPAVANGRVYVGANDGILRAFNAATGTFLWFFEANSPIESSPAVANGVVYVGSGDDNLYALNAATGTPLWSYTTGGAVGSSPAVANGVVYVGSGDDSLYAFGLPGGTADGVRRPGPASLRPNRHLRPSAG